MANDISERETVRGGTELIYRYTVTGADKASIDTGVDASEAGTNDWTNGDLLEIYLMGRTDDTVDYGDVQAIFNNDSGSNYWGSYIAGSIGSSSVTCGQYGPQAFMYWEVAGSGNAAGAAGLTCVRVPAYARTDFNKCCQLESGYAGTTSGTTKRYQINIEWTWANTAAITRVGLTPNTAGKKFKVGTQLLIYKRLAA